MSYNSQNEYGLVEGKDFIKSIDMTKYKHLELWSEISKKNEQGKVIPIPGIEYWIKSFHEERFEHYITTTFTNLSELLPFKKENKIFIQRR